jgi:hypothetical protein
MGVLTMFEERFAELRGSPRFQEAWERLRAKNACLAEFVSPEELRCFCQNSEEGYERQDLVVSALCTVAKSETEARTPERLATDLLFWIFVPALWRVVEQAERANESTSIDIQTEVVEGFWEEAVRPRSSSDAISGALVNAARHQVWRTIRGETKESHSPLEVLDPDKAEPHYPDPEWADPWLLICYARQKGVIDEAESELIFWIKLQGEPVGVVGEALGLSYSATHSKLRRIQNKLADWVNQLGDEYPPRDPSVAREIRRVAQKPSLVARLMGRECDQKRP